MVTVSPLVLAPIRDVNDIVVLQTAIGLSSVSIPRFSRLDPVLPYRLLTGL